jgi:hypothetical protein
VSYVEDAEKKGRRKLDTLIAFFVNVGCKM